MKKIGIGILCFFMLFSFHFIQQSLYANEEYIVVEFDENGKMLEPIATFPTFNEANIKRRSLGRSKNYAVVKNNIVMSVNYGVVNFNTSHHASSSNYTIKDYFTNKIGYFNAAYAADAPYLGTFENGTQVLFRLGGSHFYTNIQNNGFQLQIVPFQKNLGLSRYSVENGHLKHYISSNIQRLSSYSIEIGPAPSFLKPNTTYYSYDGHYFYTDYKTMIDDLIFDHFDNAVNAKNPYYNYYLYLPYRSKTNYTSETFKDWFVKKMEYQVPNRNKVISTLDGTHDAFVASQDTFGANALITYSIARNESGDGYSDIAIDKKNLFGHAAFDHDAYGSASGYDSNSASVYYHAETYISKGYAYVDDYRYFGSHVGDKVSGINVKYASDPYWGEKMAKNYYRFDREYGLKDYQHYTIGITNNEELLAYASAGDDRAIFSLKALSDRPVIILEKVNVNGKMWYKIQSDAPVNAQRNGLVTNYDGKYDFEKQFVYIQASAVKHIFEGKKQVENQAVPPKQFPKEDIPGDIGKLVDTVREKLSTGNQNDIFTDVALNTNVNLVDQLQRNSVKVTVLDHKGQHKKNGVFKTGDRITFSAKNKVEKTMKVIVLGDANGDGRISVADIASVIRHIEGIKPLQNEHFMAVNFRHQKNLSVSSIATIIRHIEGLKEIK